MKLAETRQFFGQNIPGQFFGQKISAQKNWPYETRDRLMLRSQTLRKGAWKPDAVTRQYDPRG